MTVKVLVVNRSGGRLAEFENANVESVMWELNAPGAASFSIPVDDPKVTSLGTTNLLTANQASGGEDGTTTGFVTYGDNVLVASASGNPQQGTRSVRSTVGAALDGRLINTTPHPSYVAGNDYLISVWVRIPAAWTGTVPFFSTDGGAGNPNWVQVEVPDMSKRDEWQRMSARITAGATGTYNHLIRSTGLTAGQFLYFDQWQSEQVNKSDLPTAWTPGGTTRPTIFYPRINQDEIQIWENDTLIWWGYTASAQSDHERTSVQCDGLLGYFRKRFVTNTSLLYTSLDQFTIAWNLLSYAQTGTDMSFGIGSATFSGSGKVRSRNYARDEHPNILDLLSEFPKLEDGFDYDIFVDGSGLRNWTPYYPFKGSRKGEFSLEWGRNISSFTYSEDGAEQANHIYVTGGSSGDVKFENNWKDNAAAAANVTLQAVISEGSQTDVNWLLERAKEEVSLRKVPIEIPSVTASRVPVDVLMGLHTGDTVPVKVSHGRVQVAADYRVIRKTWSPSSDLVTFDLNVAA